MGRTIARAVACVIAVARVCGAITGTSYRPRTSGDPEAGGRFVGARLATAHSIGVVRAAILTVTWRGY